MVRPHTVCLLHSPVLLEDLKKTLPDTQLDFFFYVQGTDIIMGTVGSHSNWSEMIYRPFWKLLFESLNQTLDLSLYLDQTFDTGLTNYHLTHTQLEPGATNSWCVQIC